MGTKARWTLLIALFALALAIAPVAVGQETEGRPDGRPDDTETPTAPTGDRELPVLKSIGSDQDQIPGLIQPLDQQILDDLIVDGSLCVGLDCVNGESFGFDTIRLKENNLRIKFQDTSSSASFPTNDWQITVNESSNGGQNKFSIDDIDGGRTPFTIEARAPSHSLYVDDGGRLGFGTNIPVVELHVKDGDTPTLRLEQDGSSGFTAQTWDVAGNETNFFIRDVTNGSKLPVRIRPGAPSSSLDIRGDGAIGIGTSSTPEERLHIKGTGSSRPGFLLEDTVSATKWAFAVDSSDGSFRISLKGTGGPEVEIEQDGTVKIGFGTDETFQIDPDGDVVGRTFTPSSDRRAKVGFAAVDPFAILEQVVGLPLSTWSFRSDPSGARHLGPMAQDFAAAFGLGDTSSGINTLDADGVALASIQALYSQNQQLEQRVAELEALVRQLLEAGE